MNPTWVSYNDGRPGHEGVRGEVLDVDDVGMRVQFVDRASPDRIQWHDMGWMMHLRPVCPVCDEEAAWVGPADGRRTCHCPKCKATEPARPMPRFVWILGAPDDIPDAPEHLRETEDIHLWDRWAKASVVVVKKPYCGFMALEHRDTGTPFTDLEAFVNGTDAHTLASEGIPVAPAVPGVDETAHFRGS